MTALGYTLFWLGGVIGLYGDFLFLAVASRQGKVCLCSCLLVPPVAVAFFFTHAKLTWRPVLLSVAGFVLAAAGCWAGGFDFLAHWD